MSSFFLRKNAQTLFKAKKLRTSTHFHKRFSLFFREDRSVQFSVTVYSSGTEKEVAAVFWALAAS